MGGRQNEDSVVQIGTCRREGAAGACAIRDFPAIDLQHDAILLDVDGTLLDLAATPDGVRVPDSLKPTLTRLFGESRGAVALISGRRIGDLDRIFAPLVLPSVGCHGAEIRTGRHVEALAFPLSEAIKNAFADAAHAFAGVWIEDKQYTLAVHYRAALAHGDSLLREMQARRDVFAPDLCLLRGKAVIEVRQPGFDKGTGLEALLAEPPFAGRRPVFFGDDITDEDVFRALPRHRGIGICVGADLKGASLRLDSPADVRRVLAAIAGGVDA
jgi:trehalose 6-phosphate phosphatase